MKFLKESIAKKKKKKLTTEKTCWYLGGGGRMFYKIQSNWEGDKDKS